LDFAEARLDRFDGLGLCRSCAVGEPDEALAAQGIEVAWDDERQVFSASASMPGVPAEHSLSCVAEGLHHRVMKWVVEEIQVGDPLFDQRVFIRTSHPDWARGLLEDEGLQSSLLTFLSDVRGEWPTSRVELSHEALYVRINPMVRPDVAQKLVRRVAFAVLALHVRRLLTA
jgi:hypothetical protein